MATKPNSLCIVLDATRDVTGMSDQQIINSLMHFANYTDEFFEASFKYVDEMGEGLTKQELTKFTDEWLSISQVDIAVESAIESAMK